MKIVKIGGFNKTGALVGWHFDLENEPGYCAIACVKNPLTPHCFGILGEDIIDPNCLVTVNGIEIVEWTEMRKKAILGTNYKPINPKKTRCFYSRIEKIGSFDKYGMPYGWLIYTPDHDEFQFKLNTHKGQSVYFPTSISDNHRFCLGIGKEGKYNSLDTYCSVTVNGVEIVEWTEMRRKAMVKVR